MVLVERSRYWPLLITPQSPQQFIGVLETHRDRAG